MYLQKITATADANIVNEGLSGYLSYPQSGDETRNIVRVACWFFWERERPLPKIIVSDGNDHFAISATPSLREDVIAAVQVPASLTALGIDFYFTFPTSTILPGVTAVTWTVFAEEGNATVPLIRFCSELRPGRAASPPSAQNLLPAFVVGVGRSGTTALMRLLLQHPSIVGGVRYPHELMFVRYVSRVAHMVAAAYDYGAFQVEDIYEQFKPVGPNPFLSPDFLGYEELGVAADALASAQSPVARILISHFYGSLSAAQGKPKAKYFLEKSCLGEESRFCHEVFGRSASIFIVRDPRDTFASRVRFNRKRNRPAFGEEWSASRADWIRMFCNEINSLWRSIEAMAGPDSVVLHFEDLVAAPERELQRVLDLLQVDAGNNRITDMVACGLSENDQMAGHRTAQNPVDTWSATLKGEDVALLESELHPFMRHFGYAAVTAR